MTDTTTETVPHIANPAHGAALQLVADGQHVHFISNDQGRCLSEHCDGVPELLQGTV